MLSRTPTSNGVAARTPLHGDPSAQQEPPEDQLEEASHAARQSHSHRPCPRCGSTRVHRSRRRGFTEHALSLVGLKMRRCHACGLRFTRLGDSVILPTDVSRGLRRLRQLALAAAGAVLVLGLLLWFTAQQAAQ